MNLKKIKILSIFLTFSLCFIFHFAYSFFPNFIFSLFFPVNESIWEHMKMMCSSILVSEGVIYFLLKKYRINHNNFLLNVFIMCLLSIVIFLIIYYPFYLLIGENFILNVLCLFITICIVNYIGYKILNYIHIDNGSLIGFVGIVLLYIIFGILTYFPPKYNIFYDKVKEKYGINNYKV